MSHREWRCRRCSRRAHSLGDLRAVACRDRDRVGRSARMADTGRAEAVATRPSLMDVPPCVSVPCPGATISPALADLGKGPWASAGAEAKAALRPGISVPSEAAVDASSAASRNTWARWRRRPVSAADRDILWVAPPPTPCGLGPAPPADDGASRDQWSRWHAATGPGPRPPGWPRTFFVNPGAVAPPPSATAHPLIGSIPSRRGSRQPWSPTSCLLRSSGAGQRAAPGPGAGRPGARGEPLRPHAGTPQA